MSPTAVSDAIRSLEKSKDKITLIRYGQSSGGQDLTAIRIQVEGNDSLLPAIAIIAGHSSYHYTTDLALMLAQRIVELNPSDSLYAQLKGRTIFILPAIHPDTRSEIDGKKSLLPRGANQVPDDEDKDGKQDEDDVDDLNQDGVISQMRILGNGPYFIHPTDARVMAQADKLKEQQGQYRLFSEGLDNDKDGQINEDPTGGIDLNKQFSHNYPWFKPGAGVYPLSSPEATAMAQFLIDRPSIQVVLVLGPDNNLTKAWEANENPDKGVHANDAPIYQLLSIQYQKSVSQTKDQPLKALQGGNLLQWLHFNMGRWVIGAPGWAVPRLAKSKKEENLTKEENKDSLTKVNKAAGAENNGQDQGLLNWLQWMKEMNVPEGSYYVPWKPFQHPDFPNEQVEIGGILQHRVVNAPIGMLDSLARQHLLFLGQVSKAMHQTTIQHIAVDNIGNGVKRLTVKLRHQGLIPPHPQSRVGLKPYAMPVIEIISQDSLRFLVGFKRQKVYYFSSYSSNSNSEKSIAVPEKNIDDYSMNNKLEWLLIGKGKITVRLGSDTIGYISRELELE